MITRQATPQAGGLFTVPSGGVAAATHWLRFPTAACPVSRNPVFGVIRIRYAPEDRVVEVVALHGWVSQFVKPAPGNPRNVEGVAARMATDLHDALGVAVEVDLWLLVRPWQILHVRA